MCGKPFSVAAVTVSDGEIAEIDVRTDVDRIAQLDVTALGD
jgi:hypothetical protein